MIFIKLIPAVLILVTGYSNCNSYTTTLETHVEAPQSFVKSAYQERRTFERITAEEAVPQEIPIISRGDAELHANYKQNMTEDAPVPKDELKPLVETESPQPRYVSSYDGSEYTEEDIKTLASLLYVEAGDIPNHDVRMEATVIVNRKEAQSVPLMDIIFAGGGSQFNGIWSQRFKNRAYREVDYQAAFDVLVNGYRSFDKDILYFTNVDYVRANPDTCDVSFVNSIDWCYPQKRFNGHSFGRRFK